MVKEMYQLHCCLPVEVPDVLFEVFTAVKIKVLVFWVVALCVMVVQEPRKPRLLSSPP
jgi:hypothetical protein